MVYCIVCNCKSRHGRSASGEKISFHKFPVGKKLRKEWELRIGQRNLNYSIRSIKAARLCSLHFTDDCYSVSRTTATSMGHTFTRWKLNDDAVPTLLINEPCHESLDSPNPDNTEMVIDEVEKKFVGYSDSHMLSDQTTSDNECLHSKKGSADHSDYVENANNVVLESQKSCSVRTNSPENGPSSSKCKVLQVKIEKGGTQSQRLTNSDLSKKNKVSSAVSSVNAMSNKESLSESESQITVEKLEGEISDTVKYTAMTNVNDKITSVDEIDLQSPTSQSIKLECRPQTKDTLKRGLLFKCESCEFDFSDRGILNSHQESCTLNDKSPYYDKPSQKEKRIQGEKVAEASNIIQICLSDYENLSTSTFFICACGFTASSSVELVAHSSAHVLEEIFVCTICKAVFQNVLQLQLHVHKSKHFWTLEGKLPSPSLLPKPELAPTSIPAPGFISQPSPNSNSSSRLIHQRNGYSTDGKFGAIDLTMNGLEHVGTPLKCGLCPFSSSSARDLLNHRKIHSAFDAMSPGTESTAPSNAKMEANGIDNKDKELLKCDLCGYSTKSAIELLQHKTFHSSEGPFRCSVCSYATKSAINLLQHKKEQLCVKKGHVKCPPSSSEKSVHIAKSELKSE